MNPWLKFSLVPVAIAGSAVSGYGVIYLDAAQAQREIFPGASFTPVLVSLNSEQCRAIESASGIRQRSKEVRAWRVSGGGWFIVDEVIGKHEFITIGVGITSAGTVKGVEIMEYRETYGGEVRNPKWRAQFIGKNKAAEFKLDADIKNISGATLSSRHVAEGVKRLLALHDLALK